jgi:hypothetical protein
MNRLNEKKKYSIVSFNLKLQATTSSDIRKYLTKTYRK